MFSFLKYRLRALLRASGYDVFRINFQDEGDVNYSSIQPYASYSPWLGNREFSSIYRRVESNTLVDIMRCFELYELLKYSTCDLAGDILEVGVWQGGTGGLMASVEQSINKETKIYLCDTFEGVVKASDNDSGYTGGEHADTSEKKVEKFLANLGVNNAVILKGIFPEDTANRLDKHTFKLCHIDVDTYDSAKDTFNWVITRLVSGGAVVFDDYGFYNCAGVTRFVNSLKSNPDLVVLHNINGHAIVLKK